LYVGVSVVPLEEEESGIRNQESGLGYGSGWASLLLDH
jgi:hypothetical protein